MKSLLPAALAFFTFVASISSALGQISEMRTRPDGTPFECEHSGLTSDLKDCGTRSDWYTYVFIGSISAIETVDKHENRLQITPEEIFYGSPKVPLTILTSQGECLSTMAVGDRWLFYLREETGKPIILDYYGNDSLPVAEAQEKIDTLRRLKTIGDFGIVRGSVVRSTHFFERKPVPGARVVASRDTDKAQFFATTDAHGDYEFEPLPPSRYALTVDRVGSFKADDDGVNVTRASCSDVTISRSPHAQISGHVRHTDGSPISGAQVVLSERKGYTIHSSDEDGSFRFDEMRPGSYVVGINLPGVSEKDGVYGVCGGDGCVPPAVFLFYPGVHNRADAAVIKLAEDEKRDDIDFTIPGK